MCPLPMQLLAARDEVGEHRVGDRSSRHHSCAHADTSVEEVPFAGEHHGDAELVGALDVGLVAHRATGLHDHRDAGRGRGLDAVGERVEGVGTRTRRPGPGRRPSSPRSRPTPPGSAGRRRCRPPGRPSPARSRSTSRGRRCARPARRRATRRRSAARLVTTRQSSRVAAKWWASCTRNPPLIWRKSRRLGLGRAGASRRRVFLRLAISASMVPGRPARRHDQVGLRTRDHALGGGGVDLVG